MILYILILEDGTGYVIEAMNNDEAYDKAWDIACDSSSKIKYLYSVSLKSKRLFAIEISGM